MNTGPTEEQITEAVQRTRANMATTEAMLNMKYGLSAVTLHSALVGTVGVMQSMAAAMSAMPASKRRVAMELLAQHTCMYLDKVQEAGRISSEVSNIVQETAAKSLGQIEQLGEELFKE